MPYWLERGDWRFRAVMLLVQVESLQHAKIIILLAIGLGHAVNFKIENWRSPLWPTAEHDELLR